MEFVNPGFLYGLFAIAIPVIIHLFNFRRFKKVYFTNVRFIKELKQQTQKQSKLKHLIVLLMRILAIVAIVLAFAQPYIPIEETIVQPDKKNAVSIFIDNSFSMQSSSDVGNLLDKAKNKAKDIISVYGGSDVFQILTNDFEGRHQRLVSQEEISDLIDEVNITAVVRNISDVIGRQSDILSEASSTNRTAYVISDFQKNIVPENPNISDSLLKVYYIPIRAINADNLYIDSCWFTVPVQQVNQNVEMNVRILNFSGNDYKQLPVKLTINGQQKALASFDILPRSEVTVQLSYTNQGTGIYEGELEISDYPVSFDDKFYFSYNVSPEIKILMINEREENIYLNTLFKNDELFSISNDLAGNIDYSSFSDFNLIVLNEINQISSGFSQELSNFVEDGGNILIVPSSKMETASFNSFLRKLNASVYGGLDTIGTSISRLNINHPIYNDVFDDIPENIDLPVVRSFYTLQFNSQSRQEELLEMQNGNIFLNVQPWKNGKVYLFATPFNEDYTSFVKHAIFVPTLYKIAVSSIYKSNLYYTIGKEDVIQIRNSDISGDDVFTIASKDSEMEFIPEHRKINSKYELYVHGQVTDAGNYLVKLEDSEVDGTSFNYDRTESILDFYTTNELNEIVNNSYSKNLQVLETGDKPFVQTLTELSQGKQFWWWFVMLALLFLLAEGLLLRFWK